MEDEITEEQALAMAKADIAGARITIDMLVEALRDYPGPPQGEEVEIASLCEWLRHTTTDDAILLIAAVATYRLREARLAA